MAGAVDRACEKFDLGVTLADANVFLRAAARKRGFDDGAVLNDHPDTTHGDVLALLEEAAALSQKRSG